ncbi:MAG: winged helix-turn-helix transcriptional regulator [Thermoplasmatota archaeon]
MPSSRWTIRALSAFMIIALLGIVSGSFILLMNSVDEGFTSDSGDEFFEDDGGRMGQDYSGGSEGGDDIPPDQSDTPDDDDSGYLDGHDRFNGSGADEKPAYGEEDQGDDNVDGEKLSSGDLGNISDPANSSSEDALPALFIPIVAITVLSVLGVIALSGRVFMDSGQQSNMVRSDLLDLITVNPGINLTSIRRELQLSQGAVSYHLRRLEKTGHILSDKGAKERRYYPSSMGYRNAMDKSQIDEAAAILSNESARLIVKLITDGPKTQTQIVRATGLSPSTVHWHMERLEKVNIIKKEPAGRSVIYHLRDLPVDT